MIYEQLPGEKIRREIHNSNYFYAAHRRKGPVDFSVVPEMMVLVHDHVHVPWLRSMLLDHFEDINNENLPTYVREQHFDIAGSLIWSHYRDGPRTDVLSRYIQLFSEANGV